MDKLLIYAILRFCETIFLVAKDFTGRSESDESTISQSFYATGKEC